MSGTFQFVGNSINSESVSIVKMPPELYDDSIKLWLECAPFLTAGEAIEGFRTMYLTPLGISDSDTYPNDPGTLSIHYEYKGSEWYPVPRLAVYFYSVSTLERIIDISRVFSRLTNTEKTESAIVQDCLLMTSDPDDPDFLRYTNPRELWYDFVNKTIEIRFTKIPGKSVGYHDELIKEWMLKAYDIVAPCFPSTITGDEYIIYVQTLFPHEAILAFTTLEYIGWINFGVYPILDTIVNKIFPKLVEPY